jgi:dienelactone hydrolase
MSCCALRLVLQTQPRSVSTRFICFASRAPFVKIPTMNNHPPLSLRNLSRLSRCALLGLAITAFTVTFGERSLGAEAPRVLPKGTLPKDIRLQPVKDLDGYFPFTPPATREEWSKRADQVRRQILVSQGLWPMPAKTPLQAVIHGKVERDDYTVEKVFFESYPGFFVTGNLYRPRGRTGPLPGVLFPHGHWAEGRFYDAGVDGVRKEIVAGEERFEEGGRSLLQALCVQLARMGCVVFHYDMLGYADSQQFSYELAHRFAKQRPEMNAPESWGLFSPQAEARLQSVMGLQTWNSVRALDFLMDLPDVDPARIAVTGASGGGTQTFLLGAIDPRPAVIFPAVMVSTAMQGGCTCENACLLRVGTGNIEFAALFAPKPLGMTAANDWTKEMATKGFPELKQHFKMMGAPDNVMLKPLLHFGHNYNAVSRAAMASWFNKHLKLGLKEPVVERDYQRLTTAEMSVWTGQYSKPAGGPAFERKLLRSISDDSDKQLASLRNALPRYRETVGGAVDVMVGRNLAEVGAVEGDLKEKADRGSYLEMAGLIRNPSRQEELPVVFLYPKEWNKQTVIWIDEEGKAGLYTPAGAVNADVQKLLDGGAAVVGVDLFGQGEFQADGQPLKQARRVKNTREAAPYTYGYNHTLFAQRVHDILTVITYVRKNDRPSKTIDLVGLAGAGPWVAVARAQARDAIDRAVVETGGFRFGKLQDIYDVNFLPGGAKYGDLPGILALNAPGKLWMAGENKESAQTVQAVYQAAGAEKNLTLSDGPNQGRAAALQWLLGQARN